MNESLIFIWFDQAWKSYAEKKQKELDFNRSLMAYDAFKAHKTDEMKAVLSINSTDLIMVPPGCTSKCHPLDVCIYKHFKGVLRNCWEDYVADIVTNLSEEEQNSEKFKLPSPSREALVNWVAEGFSYLQSHPEMIEKSFSVCGITIHNLQKVRNDECLRSIMQNVNEQFHEEEEDYLKNATKIHSKISNSVACILFSRASVYYDNINSLFSPPYLISDLTTIFL